MPIIVMIGPQGSGKGTQAELLSGRLGIPHVGMGDLLRVEIASGSDLGRSLDAVLKRGDLVPTEAAQQLLERRLTGDDAFAGVIFDGFPRNMEQLTALDAILAQIGKKLDHVICLNITDAEAEKRLAGRRICSNPACGANYHLDYRPSKEAGKCDACGSPLIQRPDDTPDAIRRRLQLYHAETERLVEFYRQWGVLREVVGERTIEEVAEDVYRAVTAGA
jgi:adenylate kinase